MKKSALPIPEGADQASARRRRAPLGRSSEGRQFPGVNPAHTTTPLQELTDLLGEEVCVQYVGDDALNTYDNEIGLYGNRPG